MLVGDQSRCIRRVGRLPPTAPMHSTPLESTLQHSAEESRSALVNLPECALPAPQRLVMVRSTVAASQNHQCRGQGSSFCRPTLQHS
jgi:hypothetical protein